MPAHESQEEFPDPNNDTDPRTLKHWLPYTDFYQWPHVILFESVEDLIDKMQNVDLAATSRAMAKYNAMEKPRVVNIWKDIMQRVAKFSEHGPF
jgi:replicative DNA helicase